MTPKMQIVWNVLEAAKSANDADIIAHCRACIVANRLGWKSHNGASHYAAIIDFSA